MPNAHCPTLREAAERLMPIAHYFPNARSPIAND